MQAELQRIQTRRVEAFKALNEDVTRGAFPEPKHQLDVAEQEFESVLEGMD